MADEVIRSSALSRERVRVIYNPVAEQNVGVGMERAKDGLRFIAVGRLAPEKRLDLVIRAFAILLRKYTNAILTIIGDGPCRNPLERFANARGLQQSVEFLGFQENPFRCVPQQSALVLASEYEGLPNVVLEALSVGLPVVAVTCPGGLLEIFETTNRIKLVAEASPIALARAMADIAVRFPERELPGDRFWRRFGMPVAVQQYEQLLS